MGYWRVSATKICQEKTLTLALSLGIAGLTNCIDNEDGDQEKWIGKGTNDSEIVAWP